MMKSNNIFAGDQRKCVVLTSDEPWSDVWHTQLHYAYQLSATHHVLFVGPPSKWNLKNLFTLNLRTQRYNDHLVLVNYINFLPLFLGYFSILVNDLLNQWLISKLIGRRLVSSGLIMWRFDHFRGFTMFNNPSRHRQIFHVIDPISECKYDAYMAKRAELVVVSSPRFVEHYRSLNRNVLQVGQGVDLEFYQSQHLESDAIRVSSTSLLLLGTLSNDIDYLLLKKIASASDLPMVLIGPNKISNTEKGLQFESLLSLENVHWLGAMPPEKFKPHLMACAAGLICYDHSVNANNALRSPLKAIGYLAAGKPIITNIDCEIPELEGKAIYFFNDEDAFLECAINPQLNFAQQDVQGFLQKVS